MTIIISNRTRRQARETLALIAPLRPVSAQIERVALAGTFELTDEEAIEVIVHARLVCALGTDSNAERFRRLSRGPLLGLVAAAAGGAIDAEAEAVGHIIRTLVETYTYHSPQVFDTQATANRILRRFYPC